jgi:hypothetical protein
MICESAKTKRNWTPPLPDWWRRLPHEDKRSFLIRQKSIMGATEARRPHPRQEEFLRLDSEEGLYGGAGGGGKTWALLRWLGDGFNVPGYTGIFFRRTYPQLSRSNDSPIAQSQEIYKPLGGVYSATAHAWTFSSGAKIEFGHLQYETSVYDYQGPSYHRVAFDELTQFSEDQYLYLFSRMRKRVGFPIPCGVRSATNPGGLGHQWVKARFVTQDAMDMISGLEVHHPCPAGSVYWPAPSRAFVPSRVADNPTIDVEDYLTRLRTYLPPVLAAQIAAGDWRVSEGTLIDPGWLRYYDQAGEMLVRLDLDGSKLGSVDCRTCRRFATIDTAGTSKDKAAEDRGRPASWSVVAIWDWHQPTGTLYLRHVGRWRVGYVELKTRTLQTLEAWSCRKVYIEGAHFGPALAAELPGLNCELVGPVIGGMATGAGGSAKLERATAAGLFTALENGKLLLPSRLHGGPAWVTDYESELLGWTGRDGETADQIDVSSYAAHVTRRQSGTWGGVISAGGLKR